MKVLSLNLWNINPPLNERMKTLDNFIKNVSPDIMCFQEVSIYNNNNNQLHDILKDFYYIYQKSGVWHGREEGLVIASKYPIIDHEFYLLTDYKSFNDMQRILLGVTVEIEYRKIKIYNTHLSYHKLSSSCRVKQLEYIKDILLKKCKHYDRCILCGDFNLFPEDMTLFEDFLKISRLHDTFLDNKNVITFSSENKYVSNELWPNRHLDFILIDSKMKMEARLCMCFSDGYIPCSDHYGVLAEGEI